MGTETDTTLLLQWYGQRDARAFREIASRYSRLVFATCRRVLGDASEAEDVAQECFLALAQHADAPPESLPAWLHVLAVRRSLNRRRASIRRVNRERQYEELRSQSKPTDWEAIMGEVDEAIAQLPEDMRAAVVLYFLEERSQQEIAATLSVSQSTVSRRIDDSIAKVRRALGAKGVAFSATALASALHADAALPIPTTLSASLGKLALLENTPVTGSAVSATTIATTIGGVLLMKKIGISIAVLVIALGGLWYATSDTQLEPLPSPTEQVVAESPESPPEESPVQPDPEPVPEPSAPEAIAIPNVVGATITGRVYDVLTDEGLEGVEITAEWTAETDAEEEDDTTTTTDSSGNYVLANLTGGADASYSISRSTPEGYRPASYMERKSVKIPPDGAATDMDFALKREVLLSGITVDAYERSVPDASIRLGGGMDLFVSDQVSSDHDGRFTFHGLPATSDLYVIAVKGETLVSQPYEFQLPERGISDLVIVLEAASSVSGIVVDPSGSSLPDHIVMTQRRPYTRVGSGGTDKTTDSAGRFEVRGLAPSTYELIAWNPDLRNRGSRQKGLAVDLQPGRHLSGLTLVYNRQLSIAGWVHNENGDPVAGASVDVGSVVYGGNSSNTDEEGAFSVAELEEGTYSVSVRAKGLMHAEIYGISAGTADLAIILPPPYRVTGTVTDALTGEPIPDFELVLTIGWGEELDAWSAKHFNRVMEPNGRFALTQTQNYRSIIAARAEGYATAMDFLDLTGPPYKHEIHLKLNPGHDLEGRVVDGRGSPIAQARVFDGRAITSGDRATTTTDDAGRFHLQSFPEKGQLISAYHGDYAFGALYVEAGYDRSLPVDIVLSDGGWVEGRVRFAEGAAPVPCAVSIVYPEGHIDNAKAEVQADGTYAIDRVAPGEVTVSLRVNSDGSWRDSYSISKPAVISEAGGTMVDFDVLPVTASLEGIIGYPDGSLPSHVTVILKVQTAAGEVSRVTQAVGGAFMFEEIPAGTGTIEIHASFLNHRYISTTVPVEILEGDTGYVEVQL